MKKLATQGQIFSAAILVIGVVFLLQANPCLSAENEVKIGAAISLSGKMAREGSNLKQGYEFWADWANAKQGISVGDKRYKVKLITYDDESNPQRSAKLVEKFITEDKVDLLLGSYGSFVSMASTTISERYGYVMILPSSGSDLLFNRGYKYLFSLLPVSSRDMVPMIDLMLQQNPKPKTLSIIASNSPYPIAVVNGLEKYAKDKGIDVVLSEKFPEDTSDLSSLLSLVKTKKPDLLFDVGYYEHSVMVTRQLKDLGFAPKGLGHGVGVQLPEFTKSLGKDAEASMGTLFWGPKLKYRGEEFTAAEYAELFKKKYGIYPVDQHGFGTSAGFLLEAAVKKAGSFKQERIREALRQIELPNTITGPIKFDEAGRNVWGKVAVIQIQKGQPEVVAPEAAATSRVIYPFPSWQGR